MTAVHVPLPVQGPLDTSSPVSSRAPSTLVEAVDADLLSWAARRGMTQQTWLYRVPAASWPGGTFMQVYDGTNGYGSVVMRSKQQYNLGTKWTLDVVFRPQAVTHSADATVPIFQWWLNGIETIGLYLLAGGSGAGDQGKLRAVVTPTSSPAVAGTTTTLTGATQLAVGTALVNTYHARLLRDRGTLTLSVGITTEATATNLSATQRHEGAASATETATAYLGAANGLSTGGNHLYKGRIARVLLRAGAASDVTMGMRDFHFVRSPGVRFAAYGRCGHAGLGQIEDSPFASLLTWSGMTFEDVTEPSPWFCPPIQGGTYFVDSLGRAWNVVMAGGWLYARRAG